MPVRPSVASLPAATPLAAKPTNLSAHNNFLILRVCNCRMSQTAAAKLNHSSRILNNKLQIPPLWGILMETMHKCSIWLFLSFLSPVKLPFSLSLFFTPKQVPGDAMKCGNGSDPDHPLRSVISTVTEAQVLKVKVDLLLVDCTVFHTIHKRTPYIQKITFPWEH